MLIKVLLGFILIALAETLNGIFRIKVLYKLSREYAKLISFLIGAITLILLNLLLLPWIDPQKLYEAFIVGVSWGILMICYDVFVGRVLFKLSWSKVIEDFNILKGNLLAFGILMIVFLPTALFVLG